MPQQYYITGISVSVIMIALVFIILVIRLHVQQLLSYCFIFPKHLIFHVDNTESGVRGSGGVVYLLLRL